jgi:hypothetical protein
MPFPCSLILDDHNGIPYAFAEFNCIEEMVDQLIALEEFLEEVPIRQAPVIEEAIERMKLLIDEMENEELSTCDQG